MLALRIIVGLGLAYLVLLLLAWLFQDRLAFPAPRGSLPDPERVGVENGEKVELVSRDGTKLVGWFLRAVGRAAARPPPSTALHRLPPPCCGSTATARPSRQSGRWCVRSSRRAPRCWSSTTRATAAAEAGQRRRPCTPPPTPPTMRSQPVRTWTRSAFTCTAARSAARWRPTRPRTV